MPNPFSKTSNGEEQVESLMEEVEGHFGCFEDGCGRVVGDALYNDAIELLTFTCSKGHNNKVSIKL